MYNKNKAALNDSATNLKVSVQRQPTTGRVYPYEETGEVKGAVLERQKLVDDYYQDYKGASYDKALKYFYQHSYRELKISGDYVTLDLLSVNSRCSETPRSLSPSVLAFTCISSSSEGCPGYSYC